MDKLDHANYCIKTAKDNHKREYEACIMKLADKGNSLKERLNQLNKNKLQVANTY